MALVCVSGMAKRRSPGQGSDGGPPGGFQGRGQTSWAPPSLSPYVVLLPGSGSDWTLQPACLLGGSGCPFAAPRMAWFLGQPPALRVLPVPPQIPWVRPPGAALGLLVTRSPCVCVHVCVHLPERLRARAEADPRLSWPPWGGLHLCPLFLASLPPSALLGPMGWEGPQLRLQCDLVLLKLGKRCSRQVGQGGLW